MQPNNNSNVDSRKPQPLASSSPSTGGNKKLKIAGITVVAVVLVSAVSAGAYYGVYLPNTPKNTLKKSFTNLLKQEQTSAKGHASFSAKDSFTATFDYDVKVDTVKNASATKLDASFSGVKLPVEARFVDKSAYVKADLSTVKSVATAAIGAEAGPYIDTISNKVSNKWIEFDESLIKTATGSDKCSALMSQTKFSDKDIDALVKLYSDNEFVDIKNKSSDTIDGRKATKMELDINKDKAKNFGKDLNKIDYFKKIEECGNSSDKTKSGDKELKKAEDFKGSYELTVWVDKGKKEIVKIAVKVSDTDGSADFDLVFNHDKVDIQKPEGAVPAMQLLSEFAPLLGVGATSSNAGVNFGNTVPEGMLTN